jgi:hypothetical protein
MVDQRIDAEARLSKANVNCQPIASPSGGGALGVLCGAVGALTDEVEAQVVSGGSGLR